MDDLEIEWTPKARAILAAASELFYAHGVHAVGVEGIAERAGVTKKTLYDRFGSKERLVAAYLTDRDERWRTFLAARQAAARETAAAQLAAVFGASADWAGEHGPKGCSMINAHAEISDPRHPAYRVIVGQKRWMLALFTDLAGRAGHPDPDGAGRVIMLLHEGALVAAGMGVIGDSFARAAVAARSALDAGLSSDP